MSDRTTHPGLLVGVDGSTPSLSAVRWAAHEAAMRNVPLTLVHAICETMLSSATSGWSADPGLWLDQENDARNTIANAVKAVDDAVESGKGPQVSTELLVSPPVPTLVELSQEAQMVVVGCRGRGALRRILLGSVSAGLVHQAHCPVAVVHDEAPTSRRANKLPVLVGVDGSRSSELAAAVAFDEASWRGVELVALHARSDNNMFAIRRNKWLGWQPSAEETVSECLAGLQERYPDVRVHRRMVEGRPARQLLGESKTAQLVVVGSYGRGGFGGMSLGSVSTEVVHAARAPVIVVRPPLADMQ
ncbi:MAG: universal stress protein [Mycobacterium sp.]|nr:universal stress protein [Mycobacterium sp.]